MIDNRTTTSSMWGVKSCPFCGGKAHMRAQHWDDGSHVWWVECTVCGAEGMRCDDAQHAIDAWNMRISILKPCPFCGGEASVVNVSYKYEQWFVTCDNDYCTAKPFTTEFDTPQKAIDAWNMRTEQTCEMVKLADYSEYVAYRSGIYVCSRCGKKSVHESSWSYCPNCGAKVVDK